VINLVFFLYLVRSEVIERPFASHDTIGSACLTLFRSTRAHGVLLPSPLAQARAPVGENYHELKSLARSLQLAYGMRVCPLPEYRRVLEPAHRDLHDAGQYLYPPLWFLRCAQRARTHRLRRTAPVAEAVAKLELKHAVITA